MRFSHGKQIAFLQYFTERYQDYWHIIYPIESLSDRDNDPYLYFYDISAKATLNPNRLDEKGIYLFPGYDGLLCIHGLEICQYALACWVAWRKTGNAMWAERAIKHCDWILDNQCDDGSVRTVHKNPLYQDLPDNWPSALAQGLAISSLVRAYKFTENEKYLSAALRALLFIDRRVVENGIYRDLNIGNIKGYIYEEYPRPEVDGVLNGHISLILGMIELSRYSEIDDIVSHNLDNVYNILPLYDSGYYSYYSLTKNISSGFYHRYVITQLIALASIDERFYEYVKIFSRYRDSRICQVRALVAKFKYKYEENLHNNS